MHHAQIAQRAFNTPLMVHPAKALAFLSGVSILTGRSALPHAAPPQSFEATVQTLCGEISASTTAIPSPSRTKGSAVIDSSISMPGEKSQST